MTDATATSGMTLAGPVWGRDLVEANAGLDRQLDRLLISIDEGSLHDTELGEELTVAQHLGALAEQQVFAARQLQDVLTRGRRVVGRQTVVDADHMQAIDAAADARLHHLLARVARASDALRLVMESVHYAHLQLVVVDVVHGRRPLRTHLLWHVLLPKSYAVEVVARALTDRG